MTFNFAINTISASLVNQGSSGGGGGTMRGNWFVPQTYLDLEEEVKNDYFYDTVVGEETRLGSFGVIIPNYGDTLTVSSAVSTANAGGIKGFRTSDGGEYIATQNNETISHTWDKTKDLNGLRWVIFYAFYSDLSNLQGLGMTNLPVNILTGSNGTLERYMKYIVFNLDQTTARFPNSFSNLFNLESFIFVNGKKQHFTTTSLGTMSQYVNFQYYPSMAEMGCADNEYQNTSISLSTSSYFYPNFPYGMDLSTVTSDITLFYGSYQRFLPLSAYITLPAVNVKISDSTSYPCLLSRDNWQYIAEHAPTVTDKTLTMGSLNQEIAGESILTILTNKGWTIA